MMGRVLVVVALVCVAASCGSRTTIAERSARSPAPTAPVVGSTDDASTAFAPPQASATPAVDPGTADAASTASAPAGRTVRAAGGAATAARAATDIGVTPSEVLLGNVSTLSGPVPGLFQGAVVGALASIAYQNSQGGVAGRKVRLKAEDDQFDSGQNRAVTVGQLDEVFAFLGSFSALDDVAAREIGAAGIPDLSYALNDAHRDLPNNFSVQPAHPGGWQLGYFNWYKAKYPGATQAVAGLYGDVPAAKRLYLDAKAAAESLGYRFVYERGIQATETDFTADVVRMRQAGVKMVYSPLDGKGSARLAKAFAQQGFTPEVYMATAAYDRAYLTLAGSAAEGTTVPLLFSMFQGEDPIPEVRLMNAWVQKVKPGYTPDLYTVLSWAQGRLLFQAMERVGPELTRARVIEAVRAIGTFDSHGLLAPANPGTKEPPTCFIVATVARGAYVRAAPSGGFICDMGGYFRR
jgi:ABC-type branched-subunit amino acid transport system substrate-binding protein